MKNHQCFIFNYYNVKYIIVFIQNVFLSVLTPFKCLNLAYTRILIFGILKFNKNNIFKCYKGKTVLDYIKKCIIIISGRWFRVVLNRSNGQGS